MTDSTTARSPEKGEEACIPVIVQDGELFVPVEHAQRFVPAPVTPGDDAGEERDGCEFCGGRKGGVPGNENALSGIVTCDYCTAAIFKITADLMLAKVSALEAEVARGRLAIDVADAAFIAEDADHEYFAAPEGTARDAASTKFAVDSKRFEDALTAYRDYVAGEAGGNSHG